MEQEQNNSLILDNADDDIFFNFLIGEILAERHFAIARKILTFILNFFMHK